jgi:NAD(P)-dependent dehydrogenase (short-subunit alcohol dehydrogenase family)
MPNNYHVLITGAGKGIGRATALHLDRLGYHVIAGVRQAADADSLRSEASDRLTTLIFDITQPADIAAALDHARAKCGQEGLYGLVNNAGLVVAAAPLEEMSADQFRYQIEVNLIAQVTVTQAFLPLLRQTKGRVINITSIGSRLYMPFNGAYSASKAGFEAVTDTLRRELLRWGVDVISVLPGTIKTNIWEMTRQRTATMTENLSDEARARYGREMESLDRGLMIFEQAGANPQVVAEKIAHALMVSHPRAHYLVGYDARLFALLLRVFPPRVIDQLLTFVFAVGQRSAEAGR